MWIFFRALFVVFVVYFLIGFFPLDDNNGNGDGCDDGDCFIPARIYTLLWPFIINCTC